MTVMMRKKCDGDDGISLVQIACTHVPTTIMITTSCADVMVVLWNFYTAFSTLSRWHVTRAYFLHWAQVYETFCLIFSAVYANNIV